MKKTNSVQDYLLRHNNWCSALELLRKLLLETGFEESIKWGAPVYMIHGKNVAGMAAFKNHVALWFFQGGLLKDPAHKLINAQEGKTKALRQWRFESLDEIIADQEIIRQYLEEAKQNQLAGKEIKPERKKQLKIPAELAQALENDRVLKKQFEQLTPGRQREYADYIAEAKRAETKQKRLEKIKPLILEGKGLYDKYKNS